MVSDISLGVFLAMSLMSIKLWEIGNAVLPIALLISLQVITIVLFTVFVLFRALGKNYDAAVMSAGYIGMGLGATPVAIANMTAISKKYGPSPVAFVLIPVIGAFFINFVNATKIPVYDISKDDLHLEDFSVGLIIDSSQMMNISDIANIKDQTKLVNSRFTIKSINNNYNDN